MWNKSLVLALSLTFGCASPPATDHVVEAEFEGGAEVGIQQVELFLASAASPGALLLGDQTVLLGYLASEEQRTSLEMTRVSPEAAADALEVTSGSNFFANWADVPGMVEAGDGSWIAHWLEVSGSETYDYGAKVARSLDRGESWSQLGWLNDDAWAAGESQVIAGEHGFVSWVPEGEGVRAFWLDGREAVSHSADGAHDGAMQLRTTTVVDGVIQASEVLDDRVCDCCPTAAVTTPNGALVAFRDRTEDEIRDIHLLRQTADGWSRTEIDTSGWEIAGCPVNGPALANDGDLVLVAWFSGYPKPTVYAAWSQDGGETFGAQQSLTTDTFGRVTAAIVGGKGYIGWLRQTAPLEKQMVEQQPGPVGGGEVRVAVLDPDGSVAEDVGLVETAASRRAGIPRLVAVGDRLGLVWTEVIAGEDEELTTNVRYQEFPIPLQSESL